MPIHPGVTLHDRRNGVTPSSTSTVTITPLHVSHRYEFFFPLYVILSPSSRRNRPADGQRRSAGRQHQQDAEHRFPGAANAAGVGVIAGDVVFDFHPPSPGAAVCE